MTALEKIAGVTVPNVLQTVFRCILSLRTKLGRKVITRLRSGRTLLFIMGILVTVLVRQLQQGLFDYDPIVFIGASFRVSITLAVLPASIIICRGRSGMVALLWVRMMACRGIAVVGGIRLLVIAFDGFFV